jgi:hypothetical protein
MFHFFLTVYDIGNNMTTLQMKKRPLAFVRGKKRGRAQTKKNASSQIYQYARGNNKG